MKHLLLSSLFVVFSVCSYAQNSFTTSSSGNWNASGSWSGGSVPGSNSGSDFTIGENFDITIEETHKIQTPGNLLFNNNSEINITKGARLIINGDFTGNAANAGFTINIEGDSSGGAGMDGMAYLFIKNDFNLPSNNNGTINVKNGFLVVERDFLIGGGSNVTFNIDSSAVIYIAGNLNKAQSAQMSMDASGGFLVDSLMALDGLSATDSINGNVMIGKEVDWNNVNLSGEVKVYSNDSSQVLFQPHASTSNNDNRPTGFKTTDGKVNGSIYSFAQDQPLLCSYSVVCSGVCNSHTNLNCPGSPLPVTWYKHIATRQSNGDVEVEWATLHEENNDYFEILRSEDGEVWDVIHAADGAGNSREEQHYAFTDQTSPSGNVYYRIKQVDYDGQYDYTPLFTAKAQQLSPELYPNPNNGTFTIALDNVQSVASLTATNAQGHTTPLSFNKIGDQELQVTSLLPSGLYTLTVTTADQRYTQKFVVQ